MAQPFIIPGRAGLEVFSLIFSLVFVSHRFASQSLLACFLQAFAGVLCMGQLIDRPLLCRTSQIPFSLSCASSLVLFGGEYVLIKLRDSAPESF